MGKIYLEITTSKYISGTSMRDEDVEYVLLDIDIPDIFASTDLFAQSNDVIKETIKKYAEENNVMLGREYNNAMVGTDMYQDQKYSTRAFIERENGYFYKILIEYTQAIKSVDLNWWVTPNKCWEKDGNRFFVRSLVTKGGSSF